MPGKRSIHDLFNEYSLSHAHPINKTLHWIAVPWIFLSLIALLWAIPVPAIVKNLPYANYWVNWGTLTLLCMLLFYLSLSRPLAVGMLLFSVIMVTLIHFYEAMNIAPLWLSALIIFAFMWVLQFIGHYIEGKKPSFFKDLQFLLIGPAWLMGFVYRKLGINY